VSNQRVQERLKLEVQGWDVHSYSFTMEGGLNPELDLLIKDVVVIRLPLLTQDGRKLHILGMFALRDHNHVSIRLESRSLLRCRLFGLRITIMSNLMVDCDICSY
jgi:hypothetical protein